MRENFDLIFELENDEYLLSFKTKDGIPIYLMAKYYLLRDVVMCKLLNLNTSENDRRINKAAFKFVGKALLHNTMNRNVLNGKEVVFYTVCRPTIIDGKFFNRYTDYYSCLLKNNSGTIEQTAMDWSWPFPRYSEAVLFDGLETIKEKLYGKVIQNNDVSEVKEFVYYFNNRLNTLCGFHLSKEECLLAVSRIALLISSMREKAKWLDRIIPRDTKLLISTGGCYPHYYPINRMLKKRNIISADLQHGFITEANLMYNYSPAIVSSEEVKEGSSDYFLTYGEWWNSQINGPSKKVHIGNPHRDYCLSKINKVNDRKRILLIGCEINTENYINLARDLSYELPEYEVVFRPHPGEVQNTQNILKTKNLRIRLDEVKEIYESLEITSMVVSEVSTVLFEAIGIVDNIVVLNTDYSKSYLPKHPFELCNNANDIVDIIRNHNEKEDYTEGMIWAHNWKDNYMNFLAEIGIRID